MGEEPATHERKDAGGPKRGRRRRRRNRRKTGAEARAENGAVENFEQARNLLMSISGFEGAECFDAARVDLLADAGYEEGAV